MRLVNLNIQKSVRVNRGVNIQQVHGNILIKFHQRPQRYFKKVTDPSVQVESMHALAPYD